MCCRYAGAGLFDSIQTQAASEVATDYSVDSLVSDPTYQTRMLISIAAVCVAVEQVAGSAQDVEGVIDFDDALHIVQTRPQV